MAVMVGETQRGCCVGQVSSASGASAGRFSVGAGLGSGSCTVAVGCGAGVAVLLAEDKRRCRRRWYSCSRRRRGLAERLFWLEAAAGLKKSKTSQAGVDWLALVWLSSLIVDSWASLELR